MPASPGASRLTSGKAVSRSPSSGDVSRVGFLIICRSRVRAPPAPPCLSCSPTCVFDSFGGWYVRLHRGTAERVVACQGIRREGPADRPRDPVPEDPQDRGRRADRARQAARARPGRTARGGPRPDGSRRVRRALTSWPRVSGRVTGGVYPLRMCCRAVTQAPTCLFPRGAPGCRPVPRRGPSLPMPRQSAGRRAWRRGRRRP